MHSIYLLLVAYLLPFLHFHKSFLFYFSTLFYIFYCIPPFQHVILHCNLIASHFFVNSVVVVLYRDEYGYSLFLHYCYGCCYFCSTKFNFVSVVNFLFHVFSLSILETFLLQFLLPPCPSSDLML